MRTFITLAAAAIIAERVLSFVQFGDVQPLIDSAVVALSAALINTYKGAFSC